MASRGKRGLGSVFQRQDGRWVVRLKQQGREVTRYAATEAEAEALRAALLQDYHTAGRVVPGAPPTETVGAYLARWLQNVEGTVEPVTYRRYAEHVRLRLVPHLGRLRLAVLTSEDVRRMLGTLSRQGAVGAVTLAATRGTLRLALRQAVEDGLLARNVAATVRPPKAPARQQVVLDRAAVQRLERVATSGQLRLGALWLLAVYTGAREGELLGASWQDMDVDTGRWIVRRVLTTDARRRLTLRQRTKRQASMRSLPLPPVVVVALRRHHAQQAAERLRAGPLWQEHGLVFCTELGTPHAPSNLIRRDWAALREAAQLPADATPHCARHTFASALLAAGRPLPEVAYLLGHSSVATTARTYAHWIERGSTGALDALGAYYASAAPERPDTLPLAR